MFAAHDSAACSSFVGFEASVSSDNSINGIVPLFPGLVPGKGTTFSCSGSSNPAASSTQRRPSFLLFLSGEARKNNLCGCTDECREEFGAFPEGSCCPATKHQPINLPGRTRLFILSSHFFRGSCSSCTGKIIFSNGDAREKLWNLQLHS